MTYGETVIVNDVLPVGPGTGHVIPGEWCWCRPDRRRDGGWHHHDAPLLGPHAPLRPPPPIWSDPPPEDDPAALVEWLADEYDDCSRLVESEFCVGTAEFDHQARQREDFRRLLVRLDGFGPAA